MFRTAAAVAALAILFDVVHAAQGSRQFSCNGGMIESTRLAPVPKTARLILSPKISLDLGQGDLEPTLMSDNQNPTEIQHEGIRRRVLPLHQ